MRSIESNIWKYTLFRITDQKVYWTILGVYFLTLPGTTPQTLGFMLLLGSVAGVIAELPSGYVSDHIGHKRALVIAKTGALLSAILYFVGSEVWMFFLASIISGVFGAFGTGTTTTFLHETLRALGREDEYAKVSGKISSLVFVIPVVLMVAVPFLVSISYKLPFLVSIILDSVGVWSAMTFVSPKIKLEKVKEVGIRNVRSVFRKAYRIGFLKYALFGSILVSIFAAVRDFKNVYQEVIGVPVIYFGVFFGVSRVLASLIALSNGYIKQHITMRTLYLFYVVYFSIVIFVLGLVPSPWMVVALGIILHAVWPGLIEVNRAFSFEIIRDIKEKATLLSITALVTTGLTGIVAFGFGYITTHFSYTIAFTISSIALVLLLTPLLLLIWKDSIR